MTSDSLSLSGSGTVYIHFPVAAYVRLSLGLAPVVINDIYEKLKEIADTGLTMLIVEQDVNRSLKSSDYAYVVLEGKIVMQGKSKELSVDEVNDAYFGINTFSH